MFVSFKCFVFFPLSLAKTAGKKEKEASGEGAGLSVNFGHRRYEFGSFFVLVSATNRVRSSCAGHREHTRARREPPKSDLSWRSDMLRIFYVVGNGAGLLSTAVTLHVIKIFEFCGTLGATGGREIVYMLQNKHSERLSCLFSTCHLYSHARTRIVLRQGKHSLLAALALAHSASECTLGPEWPSIISPVAHCLHSYIYVVYT